MCYYVLKVILTEHGYYNCIFLEIKINAEINENIYIYKKIFQLVAKTTFLIFWNLFDYISW